MRWVAIALLALAIGAIGMPAGATPADPHHVLFYGDSLATESADFLRKHLPREGWSAEVRVFPGASLCGWFERMPEDARVVDPDLVVVALVGAYNSPCTERGTETGRRCLDAGRPFDECLLEEQKVQWKRDARAIADFWRARGTPVLWASAPEFPGSKEREHPITRIYTRLVEEVDGQHFVDAAASLQAKDGSWPVRLPCRRDEDADKGCVNGKIKVRRSAENGHLCPTDAPSFYDPCDVYSSGVARWAGEIVEASQRLMARIS